MLLAGDVGGTKTLLGLYTSDTPRPSPVSVRRFTTLEFESLGDVVAQFLRDVEPSNSILAGCFGVAGPVRDQVAQLTNVPWRVDAEAIAERFTIPRVHLINDLVAMGHAVPFLAADEVAVLQHGESIASGNAALIAPGTGLGQTLLHNVDGLFIPSPSEGGHADFAPRTSREIELLEALTARLGRVEYDQVVSGPGLLNIHRFVHGTKTCGGVPARVSASDAPALISTAALERRCQGCVETLDMFVSAFGSEAGNFGLRSLATAGVYLGGGIPPKILPALQTAIFLDAFRSKAPMDNLMAKMPVAVILEPNAALLGAAVAADQLATTE
jgi:glucokinase